MQSGATAIDQGVGGGFCRFLAAREIGGTRRMIGVDMAPDVVLKARANVLKGKYENVGFRLALHACLL